MALTGKPSVIEARAASAGETSAALRPLQSVIAAIRERLRLIEAELNALITRTADVATGGTAGASFNSLQEQINALRLRIEALEAITLTDWYVNGGFIATRRVVNFIQAGGITISGADDGSRANITFGALVDILIPLSLARTTLLLTGRQVGFQLGRFIDVSRRSLVLTGRTLGLALSSDTLLTVNRGALRLSGRSLGLELTQDVDLPVSRGALRLAGRNVGLAANLAVARGHLSLAGRNIGLAATGNVSLAVARGHLALSSRDVTVTPGAFTFFRNYADLSTANLTSYQGTISAATGNLVASPTGTHHRVYFDLLPPGSPTFVSGAFDLTAHFNGNGSFCGVLIFSNGDDGSTATYQNGYWVDCSSNGRLIRFISGGSANLGSGGGATPSFPFTMRVTRDASGKFDVYMDGVHVVGPVTDTTYTQGRMGLVFATNLGTPVAPNVDYGINYTP